jgi:hypothetical protein
VSSITDLLNINRPKRFLTIGEAFALRVGLTKEIGDEGLHTAASKEGGGVVFGDEGTTGDDGVTTLLVEIEKFAAELIKI